MSELLKINVNEHTEKKGQLTYLSWAWAWAEVLKHDPAATWGVVLYSDKPCMMIGDTAMVHTWVTIKGVRRECMLPCMDNKNNAIKNPDARKISDTLMRCMTKACAMHGLGLYIYAGEDLPQVATESYGLDARKSELAEIAQYMIDCHESGEELPVISMWYDPKSWSDDIGEKQEEQIYVWGLLKPYSKLRSAIKANNPNNKEPE